MFGSRGATKPKQKSSSSRSGRVKTFVLTVTTFIHHNKCIYFFLYSIESTLLTLSVTVMIVSLCPESPNLTSKQATVAGKGLLTGRNLE